MIPLTPEQQRLAAEAYPVLRQRRIIDRDGRGVFGLLNAARHWDGERPFNRFAARCAARDKIDDARRQGRNIRAGRAVMLDTVGEWESNAAERDELLHLLKLRCPDEAELLLETVDDGAKAIYARSHGIAKSTLTKRVQCAMNRVRKAMGVAVILVAFCLPATAHAALKWIDITARPDWSTRTGTYTPTIWLDDGTGFPGIAADSQQTADTMMELGAVSVIATTRPTDPAPTFTRGADTLTISSLMLLDDTATYDGLFPLDLKLDHPELIGQPITLTSTGYGDITYTLSDGADVPEPGPVLLVLGIAFAWACRDARSRRRINH